MSNRVESFRFEHHATILRVLKRHGPQTVHEMAAHCGLLAHQIGKRMCELQRQGLVVLVRVAGFVSVRSTPGGGHARVWRRGGAT